MLTQPEEHCNDNCGGGPEQQKLQPVSSKKEGCCGGGCKEEQPVLTKKEGCCGGGCEGEEVKVKVEENELAPLMEAGNTQKLIFKIEGMCCASEIDSLKRVVNPLLKGKDAVLSFDLINAKLILDSKNGEFPAQKELISAVAKTGMKASLWSEYIQHGEKTSCWKKYSPMGMNILSAATLVAGLIIHAYRDGATAAFGGMPDGKEAERPDYPPIATMVLYSTAIVAGGWFIFPRAAIAVKRLRPDPNLLMTIATFGAVGINHWFEATFSMYLFSLAAMIETWNMGRARKAIRALMELAPPTAQVLNEDGTVSEELVGQVPVDTILIIKPGEKIPMDSVVISGSTSVNQAPITGESMPVLKEVGNNLFAGTINEDGAIQCRVTKEASDSTLASIIRKVEEAQSRRARSDQWIEKFSHYYVPTVMVASAVVCTIPPLVSGNFTSGEAWFPWLYKGLELLVISCPCSLVISTPVSIVAGLTAAARSGVLIKGGVYLEMAASMKAFAMDKTGTLTNGAPIVQHIIPLNGYDEESLLKLAGALEVHSDHPLARSIQRKAKGDGLIYEAAEQFQIFKGRGGEGYVNGELFWIGSHRFLHEKVGDNEPKAVHERIQALEALGHSIVAIGQGENICGLISIADSVRAESKNAIQALKRAGVHKVVMLTGDNQGAAKAIAESIAIDEYHAELLPEDKISQVKSLVQTYKKVAMVGDGINDAPAMATASLGIAMGAAGSDAAIETADIALMSDDLEKLAWLVKHSRHTLNVIKQNVVFSLAVKAIFTGLIFANKSTLWMAMASDMGATFIVVSNALRLVNNKQESKRGVPGGQAANQAVGTQNGPPAVLHQFGKTPSPRLQLKAPHEADQNSVFVSVAAQEGDSEKGAGHQLVGSAPSSLVQFKNTKNQNNTLRNDSTPAGNLLQPAVNKTCCSGGCKG